jgi:hypothetical protein
MLVFPLTCRQSSLCGGIIPISKRDDNDDNDLLMRENDQGPVMIATVQRDQ